MMEADNQEDLINMSYNASNFSFEVLFEYRPLKIVGIGFASVSTLFIIFLSYGIIWFERFGSGNHFLLMTQFIANIKHRLDKVRLG
jgi:hypothetical protein